MEGDDPSQLGGKPRQQSHTLNFTTANSYTEHLCTRSSIHGVKTKETYHIVLVAMAC